MTGKTRSLLRLALLGVCGGIGFNISQRLLDHFIDFMVDNEVWLAWLK